MTTDRENRQVRIETLLAHLQQDIEQINTSLTHHLERLQETDLRIARIERELELIQQPAEQRDPRLERPPHY
ncbi:MAG: SlyX family protein [Fuerstiella sp.]|nr:SlyX family protein [Fuerstiella sp.]